VLKTIMDSGANEVMINSEEYVQTLHESPMLIHTASRDDPPKKGSYGTAVPFLFSDGKTQVKYGKQNKAVFSTALRESLTSVRGRFCGSVFQ
jgi:hypothetical protein